MTVTLSRRERWLLASALYQLADVKNDDLVTAEVIGAACALHLFHDVVGSGAPAGSARRRGGISDYPENRGEGRAHVEQPAVAPGPITISPALGKRQRFILSLALHGLELPGVDTAATEAALLAAKLALGDELLDRRREGRHGVRWPRPAERPIEVHIDVIGGGK